MTDTTSFGRRRVAPALVGVPERKAAAPRPAINLDKEALSGALAPVGSALSHVPFVAIGLLALLIGVFWMQGLTALEPLVGQDFSYRSVIAQGAVSEKLVFGDGQWWRVLTAPLLHGSVSHIVGNGFTLLLVGWRLERLIGRRWFAAIFALSAIGGSMGSMLLRSNGDVSVGASGAIMGLLAAAIVCSLHAEAYEVGPKMRKRALWLSIPALIPTSGEVDYSAHLGGALTGIVIGFVLQMVWPETERRPGFTGVALTAAGVWALASAAAWAPVAQNYQAYVARNAVLIPDSQLPADLADESGASIRLAARYPEDPRSNLIRALAHLKQENARAAEHELRQGLARTDRLANDLPPQVSVIMQGALALTLSLQGRDFDALEAAAPVCKASTSDPNLRKMRSALKTAKLCA